MYDMKLISARIKSCRQEQDMTQEQLGKMLGLNKSTIQRYENGKIEKIKLPIISAMAKALNVSPDYLCGTTNQKKATNIEYAAPNVSEDYVSFPVIGEIAAGFDSIGIEDWAGDTIDVPLSYLKGHKYNDFFVLSVKGDSMYPLYHNGDKVLILKRDTLDYSGQIGAVLYDDEYTTLKKVEYKTGEDWLTLVPINPNYQPTKIENEALEHCRIIGVPKLLIREIEE